MSSRINSRTKGQTGEREIADKLNEIVSRLLAARGQVLEKPLIQRNQNQSAVGGADLSNTFDFAIEVKRHEKDNPAELDKWWAQCMKSAGELQKTPVLVYRKNRRPWRIRMPGIIYTDDGTMKGLAEAYGVVECGLEQFLDLFEKIAINRLA